MQRTWLLLTIAIALIQIFDITIHAATNQLEFLRVTSNIVILVWLGSMAAGKLKDNILGVSISLVGLYLILNFLFLLQEGFTNPEQGGAPRTILFLLVMLTVGLSALLTFKPNR